MELVKYTKDFFSKRNRDVIYILLFVGILSSMFDGIILSTLAAVLFGILVSGVEVEVVDKASTKGFKALPETEETINKDKLKKLFKKGFIFYVYQLVLAIPVIVSLVIVVFYFDLTGIVYSGNRFPRILDFLSTRLGLIMLGSYIVWALYRNAAVLVYCRTRDFKSFYDKTILKALKRKEFYIYNIMALIILLLLLSPVLFLLLFSNPENLSFENLLLISVLAIIPAIFSKLLGVYLQGLIGLTLPSKNNNNL